MKLIISSFAILAITLPSTIGLGQESNPAANGQPEIVVFEDTDSDSPLTVVPAEIIMAGHQRSYSKAVPPSNFSLINDPSIQKDLELVGEQLTALKEMQVDWQQQVTTQMQGLRDGSLSGDEYTKLLYLRKANEEQRIKEFMLPHQLARLQQIRLQTHMRQAGTANAVSSVEVANELGLTPEQQAELKEKAVELKKKLEKEIKRLKEESENELLQVLTPDQRAKLSEMRGDEFNSTLKDWKEATAHRRE